MADEKEPYGDVEYADPGCQADGKKRGTRLTLRLEVSRARGKASNCSALCREPSRALRLSVDHDHSCCGKDKGCSKCIRGLLCSPCNRMLGLAEGRELVRARFLDYLTRRPLVEWVIRDA